MQVTYREILGSIRKALRKNRSARIVELDDDEHSPGGSDHMTYISKGIPAFFFFSGLHADLHKPGDDPGKIDYPKAAAISRLSYLIARKLGNMDVLPSFHSPEPDMAWFGTGMSVKLIGVNLFDPTTPRVVSVRHFPGLTGGAFGMAKSGNYLYLATGGDGLYVMNISDPANPVLVDSLPMPGGQVRDVVVRDSMAYLAHGEGLKVANTGDPANLRLLSGTGYGYNSIALDESFLYAGKLAGGIDVYRLTNPQEPELVSSMVNADGVAWDLTCHHGMVLESTDRGGLFVYGMENGKGIQKAYFPNTDKGRLFPSPRRTV